MALSTKRECFIAEYLTDGNATRSYIAAGYSPVGATAGASRLLANVSVRERLAELQGARLEKLAITADRVLAELAKLAFFDPRKFFNPDGSAKPIAELDEDTAAALCGMEVVELFEGTGDERRSYGVSKRFKLADKGQNLERLGRHLRLFTDRVEHGGALTLSVIDEILESAGQGRTAV